MIIDKQLLSKEPSERVTAQEAVDIISILEKELANSVEPGIGLAAPQIGINKAVAIVRINNYKGGDTFINLVNPVLLEAENIVIFNEGCLSFPGDAAKTVRYANITLETLESYDYWSEFESAKHYGLDFNKKLSDFQLEKRQICCSGLAAICVEHEAAHLLGLTMFDFAPKEIGRNDKCPCGAGIKNKKCHNFINFNDSLNKLFKPEYK